MDKHKENSQIPVNTRIIGTPSGIYVLYLEDYVHTFVKKLLEEIRNKDNLYNCTDEIFFYGNRFEEDKQIILVVSGALDVNSVKNKKEKYFSEISLLGIAKASLNKDLGIRIELDLNSDVNVILDDFYIYYDQNEEMQNYLIEWNLKHQTAFTNIMNVKESLNKDIDLISDSNEINSKCSGVIQNDKDEMKVGSIWNTMNVLSLGFVICVTVYGIVSINNYQKMQGIKENVDYCMSVISDNMYLEKESLEIQNYETECVSVSETGDTIETIEKKETIEEDIILEENTSIIEDMNENSSIDIQETEPVLNQTTIPQYYIIRKGDTLRNICIEIYGDYSKVNEVCKYNNIDNPDDILYGQRLLLP